LLLLPVHGLGLLLDRLLLNEQGLLNHGLLRRGHLIELLNALLQQAGVGQVRVASIKVGQDRGIGQRQPGVERAVVPLGVRDSEVGGVKALTNAGPVAAAQGSAAAAARTRVRSGVVITATGT